MATMASPPSSGPPQPSSLSPSLSPRSSSSGSLLPATNSTANTASNPCIPIPIANGQSVLLTAIAPPSNEPNLTRFIGPGILSAYLPTLSPTASNSELKRAVESITVDANTAPEQKEGEREAGTRTGRITGVVVLPLLSRYVDGEGEGETRTYHAGLTESPEEKGGMAGVDVDVDVLIVGDRISTESPAEEGRKATRTGPRMGQGAGWVLAVKMAGAAAGMGYGFEEVRRVARLVGENVGSVVGVSTSTASVEGVSDNRLGDQVTDMLARLLRPNSESTLAQLRVTSNEPVLLLDTRGSHTTREIHALLSHTIRQLQGDYNVKPVRVYAGAYMAGPDESEKGFSISVLNVVNTEIGGPSMIQLLDAPCESEGWRVRVTKEEWERSDGSVEGIVELGLKNWGGGESVGLGRPEEEVEDGPVEPGSGLDQEAGNDVLRPGAGQWVTVDESAAAAQEPGDEAPPEMEVVKQREQEQDGLLGPGSLKTREVEAGIEKMDAVEEAEGNAGEHEREAALNPEVREVKDKSEHVASADAGKSDPSSEEGFEMVERERIRIYGFWS